MKRATLLVALILILIPMIGRASTPLTKVGYRGWGPRFGITANPDQIHFGAHIDFGNFAQHVRFQPNIEVGVGDGLALFALNFEAAYRFAAKWDVWTPYAGGGLGINYASFNGSHGDNSTDLGVNVIGGIEKGLASGSRLFTEIKLGLGDSPDFKWTVGWTFYH